ncbi:MAG: hypothetical protein CFK52_08795 [Chloracidobacterium sp. CP2_5A]|nr:MAG: hypothetical protein CFK52_08795 [Chloracidobacterium sp. CP2_5A]
MLVVASLWASPLACVLTCLLGGCAQAAEARAAQPAGASALSKSPTAETRLATKAKLKPEPACCASKRVKVCQTEPAAQPTADSPSVAADTGVRRGQSPRWLLEGGATGCGCYHPAELSRFTVSPVFALDAPLATTTLTLATRAADVRPSPTPRRAPATYVPSRRETYLRCRVFRI